MYDKKEENKAYYYYYITNGMRGLIATNKTKAYLMQVNSDGIDTTTDLSIFPEDHDGFDKMLSAFKGWFAGHEAELYDWWDIESEYSDDLFVFSEDDYDELYLLF